MRRKLGVLFLTVSLIAGVLSGCGTPATGNEAGNQETKGTETVVESDAVSDTEVSEGTEASTEASTEATEEVVNKLPAGEYPTAQDVVNEIVIGWNVGNCLDAYKGTEFGAEGLESENVWGNPNISEELILKAKESGFNAIRVPVTWYNHMDPVTNEIDKAWMDRVEEVVKYVLDNDLYCIINVHHDTGEKGWLKVSEADLDVKKARFQAIWEQVAERFGDYDEKLLFEGYNEILDDETNWVKPAAGAVSIANDLNQLFVDTVRASGKKNGNRVLIVNTYCAGANKEVLEEFVLPTDVVADKLIVEAHIYQPYYFTIGTLGKWASGKNTLDGYIKNMNKNFIEKGVPVIIGEFGTVNTVPERERQTWLRYYIDTCLKYGIKVFWWDNGNEYKLFNRNTLTVVEPELIEIMMVEANGGTYEFDMTLYGDANADGSLTMDDLSLLQGFMAGTVEKVENCDMNKDGVVDSVDEQELTKILEDMNNLCSNDSKWTNWVNVENGAKGKVTVIDTGCMAEVEKPGGNTWDVQFSYSKLTMEQGATYKISFDYSSSHAQNMSFNVMQDYGDYLSYYGMGLDYSTETQHFETVFTMTEPTDNNSRITFDCGAGKVGEPYSIKIENLVLIKLP